MPEMTTIPVSKKTRDKLKLWGLKGDTYDAIIQRLMERAEYEEFMEKQYQRLAEKEKFIPLEEL